MPFPLINEFGKSKIPDLIPVLTNWPQLVTWTWLRKGSDNFNNQVVVPNLSHLIFTSIFTGVTDEL